MGTHPIFESDFDCLTDKKSVNMNNPTCELNLDPASMKIMNVFKQDNIQTLRSENQKLRDRLRQFKESDAKKTQDLKSKNDDLSALQKELSNTRHRYFDHKTERTKEMADLREELEKRTSDLEDMQKQMASEERTTKNYQRELDINQKELQFLREELRDAKAKLEESLQRNVELEALQIKEDIAEKKIRQAEMDIEYSKSFRHDAARVKILEKELSAIKNENIELRKQAKDKAIAIESEKLWKSRVNRIQPKCDLLEEENERIQGELQIVNNKNKRLESELSGMRLREFAQTEEIGKVKAELAVEKSRSTAWKEQIETLKLNLEETKRDINLSQSAIQGLNEFIYALKFQINHKL